MILKAYKYRIYPTKKQTILLDKHIGAARFIYNLALETKQTAYVSNKVNLTAFDLGKQLPELKKECIWLKEVNSQTLHQAIINLDSAYINFFKGNAKYPRFKSKHKSKFSFGVPQNVNVDFKNNKLDIPKFKEGIDARLHRTFDGKVKQATITKTPTGKYFASILVESNEDKLPKGKITTDNTIGIDLGIKDFIITNNGDKFDNPKYLKKSLSRLKYLQRKYSKCKGKRTKHQLALLHEKVANQRKDYIHKISTQLIRENQTIAIEDLNINGMVKNHCLAQAISDVGWGMLGQYLHYKSDWYGASIIKIGRFEPSSKVCSNCGNINKSLTLNDRTWICSNCNTDHDRDINAAINIKNFALKNYVSGTDTKNQKELPTLVGALTSEVAN